MQERSVAIVIPVYNRRETTLQALRSLARIDAAGLSVKVYIVDDGSNDGTTDAVRKAFPEVTLVAGDGTLHYAAGTNRGIEAALKTNPEFVVTANDDAVFHEQFLQRLIETADGNPRSVIGAMLLLWDRPHTVFQVDFRWSTLHGGWSQPNEPNIFDLPRNPFEVEGLAGNCVLIPTNAIRECGLMDEKRFPHGWGDIQYFVRMRRHGWKLMVDPRSYIWCEPNTNPKPLHATPVAESIRILFKNRRHPLNLQRQFIARWESAPSKGRALAAFSVYLVQLSWKAVREGGKTVTRAVLGPKQAQNAH